MLARSLRRGRRFTAQVNGRHLFGATCRSVFKYTCHILYFLQSFTPPLLLPLPLLLLLKPLKLLLLLLLLLLLSKLPRHCTDACLSFPRAILLVITPGRATYHTATARGSRSRPCWLGTPFLLLRYFFRLPFSASCWARCSALDKSPIDSFTSFLTHWMLTSRHAFVLLDLCCYDALVVYRMCGAGARLASGRCGISRRVHFDDTTEIHLCRRKKQLRYVCA